MKKIIILIIIFLNFTAVSATNFSDFLNLKTGNIFVYNCTNWSATPPYQCNGHYRVKIVITDTVNYSGIKYFSYSRQVVHISGTCSFSSFMFPFNAGNYNTLRLDSLSGMVFYYNPGNGCTFSPNETMIDSLNTQLNDLVTIRCVPSPYSYTCTDTVNKRKYYTSGGSIHGTIRREYVRGIGLVNNYQYKVFSGSSSTNEQTLAGRVINGVVYGDTALYISGIRKISSEIPSALMLYQNYPNPFNPKTFISFQLPVVSSSSLKIFDISGKEVATLFNERLNTGTYTVDWDASDFPSGVYLYKISADGFTETKKMILLK